MILARVHPNTLQHGFRCRALHQRESQSLSEQPKPVFFWLPKLPSLEGSIKG